LKAAVAAGVLEPLSRNEPMDGAQVQEAMRMAERLRHEYSEMLSGHGLMTRDHGYDCPRLLAILGASARSFDINCMVSGAAAAGRCRLVGVVISPKMTDTG
jgi:hypothetical protein